MQIPNRLLIRVIGIGSAAIGLFCRVPLSSCCGRRRFFYVNPTDRFVIVASDGDAGLAAE